MQGGQEIIPMVNGQPQIGDDEEVQILLGVDICYQGGIPAILALLAAWKLDQSMASVTHQPLPKTPRPQRPIF